jgi:hypothetical protein
MREGSQQSEDATASIDAKLGYVQRDEAGRISGCRVDPLPNVSTLAELLVG